MGLGRSAEPGGFFIEARVDSRRFPPPWSVEKEETCSIAHSAAAPILADA
jgi:hypothetical protein